MSGNKKVVIGIVVGVILFLALGLLRFNNRVYWRSGGQRGFSTGAAMYQMMGWGAENYMADMGFEPGEDGWTTEVEMQLVDDNDDGEFDRGVAAVPAGRSIPLNDVQLIDDDGDGVPDRGVIAYSTQNRYDKFDRYGFDRGFNRDHRGPGCFFLLLVLGAIGGGIYYYRRRKASASTGV